MAMDANVHCSLASGCAKTWSHSKGWVAPLDEEGQSDGQGLRGSSRN